MGSAVATDAEQHAVVEVAAKQMVAQLGAPERPEAADHGARRQLASGRRACETVAAAAGDQAARCRFGCSRAMPGMSARRTPISSSSRSV
jgi:hypothetical protein